jgi:hypothetical protein
LSWCIYWFLGGRIVFSKSYSVSESSQEWCLLLRQSLKTKCSLEIPSLWVLNWLTGKVYMSHELQLLLCSVIVSFVTAKQKLASNYFKLPFFHTDVYFPANTFLVLWVYGCLLSRSATCILWLTGGKPGHTWSVVLCVNSCVLLGLWSNKHPYTHKTKNVFAGK